MLPRSCYVLWFASCTVTARFYRRGSANDTALYSNVTTSITVLSIATSINPPVTPASSGPLYPLRISGTDLSNDNGYLQPTAARSAGSSGPNTTSSSIEAAYSTSDTNTNSSATTNLTLSNSGPWINATFSAKTRVSNATCTINIPHASIDYWHPPTYSHMLGTITTKFANYSKTDSYTLVTNTATFDAASALESNYACTTSESYISEWDFTLTQCYDYTEKPTAATTAVVYRTAAAPFPPEGSIAVTDVLLYDLYTEQPVATHPISIAPNRTFEQISATPYVYFTAYQIESGNKTETVQLSSAYIYPYWVKDIEHEAAVTGALPAEFVQQIPQTDCDAGQLQATVTVVIVVDLHYQNWPELDPFIHFESTASGFDDPIVSINDDGGVRPVQITGDNWEFSGAPTPASINANMQTDSIPTTQAGGNNNNNNNNNNQGAASNRATAPNVPQPTPVTVGNVGTIPVILGPSSVVVVGSQTLQPGAPAVIVGGVTPVSLVPQATALVVAGATTIQLPPVFNNPTQEPVRPPPVLTIGSSTLTPNAATQFFIAPGQTLSPGGTVTVDGTIVSLAPSAAFVVVGSSTQFLPTAGPGAGPVATNPPQIMVGGSTIVALPPANNNNDNNNNNNENNNQNNVPNFAAPAPTFVVDGQTLVPGGQAITISGTTISFASGGTAIVVNGVTSAVVNPPTALAQPSIVVGGDVFTPVSGSGSTFVIGGQTLTPGGQAITVSGTTISLASSASFVVVNGATSTLANSAPTQTTPPVLTIGNDVFRPLPGNGASYLVGSLTLTPGGIITVSGSTISLAAGATAIVINGQTSLLTPLAGPITNAPLLTIGSQTYTAISSTAFVIDGQTLTPGGTITVNGTTISLAPGATQLVYGSSGQSTTSALFPATTTRSQSTTTTASASARASGSNGQAAATSSRQGTASLSRIDDRLFSLYFMTVLGSSLLL